MGRIRSRPAGLLRDRIYGALRRAILTGLHQPGQRLSVSQIAKRYKASAAPVREALAALQKDGLVEIIPRAGCFVSQVTVQDVMDTLGLRVIVEGAAAELAANNITDDELRYLQELPDDFTPGDAESYLQYLEANRDFHCTIARASRNRLLAETVGKLLDHTQRVVVLALGSTMHETDIVNAHRDLIVALKKRDAAQAKQVMVRGIEDTREAALGYLLGGGSAVISSSNFRTNA